VFSEEMLLSFFFCAETHLYEKNIQLAEKSGFQIDSDSSVC